MRVERRSSMPTQLWGKARANRYPFNGAILERNRLKLAIMETFALRLPDFL